MWKVERHHTELIDAIVINVEIVEPWVRLDEAASRIRRDIHILKNTLQLIWEKFVVSST